MNVMDSFIVSRMLNAQAQSPQKGEVARSLVTDDFLVISVMETWFTGRGRCSSWRRGRAAGARRPWINWENSEILSSRLHRPTYTNKKDTRSHWRKWHGWNLKHFEREFGLIYIWQVHRQTTSWKSLEVHLFGASFERRNMSRNATELTCSAASTLTLQSLWFHALNIYGSINILLGAISDKHQGVLSPKPDKEIDAGCFAEGGLKLWT